MDFNQIESELAAALDRLVHLMDVAGFETKGEWAAALTEVVNALRKLVNSDNAREKLVNAVAYRWFGSQVSDELKKDVRSIVQLALVEQIDMHSGDSAKFGPNALATVYKRRRLPIGIKWRVTTAFSIALGSPFIPIYGMVHAHAVLRESKDALIASRKHLPLEDEPTAPDHSALLECPDGIEAEVVERFVRQKLAKKPKQLAAVLHHLDGLAVKDAVNLRLGINNTVVAFFYDFLQDPETQAEMQAVVAIVRGEKALLRKIKIESVTSLCRLMADLPMETVRGALRLVPRSHVAAWVRNATTIVGVGTSSFLAATASATMMV